MSPFVPYLCSCAAALMLAAAYPRLSFWPAAWPAFAFFAVGILRSKTRREYIVSGYLAGFVLYSLLLYWIYNTCRAGGLSVIMSGAAWLALAAVLAVEGILLACVCRMSARTGGWFPFAAACGLAGLEFLKLEFVSRYFIWLPWFMTGYTQWNAPLLIQAADVAGVTGIGFLVSYFGFSLGYGFNVRGGKTRFARIMIPSCALIVAALIYGAFRMRAFPEHPEGARKIRVSVLQPNIDQYKKWDERYVGWIENAVRERVDEAAAFKPDFVLWPESSLPGWMEDEGFFRWAGGLAGKTGADNLIGSVSLSGGKHVCAFMLAPDAEIKGVYSKRQLVPFGEYVPLRAFLGRFVSVLNEMGEFLPGAADQRPLTASFGSVGPTICYEAVFPYLSTSHSRQGAVLLANITNDGWYLDTSAPYQHFAFNIFRAVENRRPVLRAGNNGISAYIDPAGRVISSTRLYIPAVLNAEVSLPECGTTFYARHENLFGFAAIACFTAIMIFFRRKEAA